MLLNFFTIIGDAALDFLSWYDKCESLWKLLLIPICVIVYAIMIICDAADMILDQFEE